VNDCDAHANACMRKVLIKGSPHLALLATIYIVAGEEILYDYEDKLDNHW
jgi:sensor domain CHASE-containing protein